MTDDEIAAISARSPMWDQQAEADIAELVIHIRALGEKHKAMEERTLAAEQNQWQPLPALPASPSTGEPR